MTSLCQDLYSQNCDFSSSHVQMWELDHEEGRELKSWCFWTVVLDKTLKSPLDCKEIQPVSCRGNQPWTFIEGLMLKLKPYYSGHMMWRANSLEKTLMLGKVDGKRRSRQLRIEWLDSITDSIDMNLSKLQEIVEDREAWCAIVHGVPKNWTWLRDWTTMIVRIKIFYFFLFFNVLFVWKVL